MKQILLKKIAIIVAKLIRSRVLQVGWGFTGLQGAGMEQENFSQRQNHMRRVWRLHHLDPLRSIAISTNKKFLYRFFYL